MAIYQQSFGGELRVVFANLVSWFHMPNQSSSNSERWDKTESSEDENMLKKAKALVLRLCTDYERDPRSYWDMRWRTGYDSDGGVDGCPEHYKTDARAKWLLQIQELMMTHDCTSILDVGCGKAWLRTLPGYLGLDWSLTVFKQNGLSSFIVADASTGLPLPSKSFDAACSFVFLMHQPLDKAQAVSREMMRVTKRLIILREETSSKPLEKHCFNHDYDMLFNGFEGKKVMLEW